MNAPPLLATGDPALLEDLLRLAAAASTPVETARTVDRALRLWPRAPLVVLGTDLQGFLRGSDPPPHPRFVVVGRPGSPPAAGGAAPMLLPRDESALAGMLARAGTARPAAPSVSVVGGRGGAGASILCVALALAAGRSGRSAALIDADPFGCGPDLYLGQSVEPKQQTGWHDLVERRGRVHWRDLGEGLPGTAGVSVLTWARDPGRPRSPLPADAARAALASARYGTDLVVADLPRWLGAAGTALLNRSDLALLVVPAEVPAVVAAHALVPRLRKEAPQVRAVVRGASGELTADVVARSLGVPLAADLPAEPGLERLLAAGRVPADHPRSPLARFSDHLVSSLLAEAAR
ncbi:septum site-determining protein Ssd [Nocardiopsis algeriensis]|uniref:Secretion/DNA translocation related CpaE-like protein n=1 Tax=Nocardiopsis algeriensis TaxID=1478215 RepID=A0A841J0Q3_9ACTN|nr:secretion/DNA translocation related CpaE-like protein [Nocardiopsis algeriensis]